jgi:Cu/Ag efflux pump CusA
VRKAAGRSLVEQYPNVAPPQVAVTATYPGASPELQLSQANRGVHESVVNLYTALGGGWQPDAAAGRSVER